MNQDTLNRYSQERKGRSAFVIVEGYHALKHAYRFKAEISEVYIQDQAKDQIFGETVRDENFDQYLQEQAEIVSTEEFMKLSHGAARTGLVARVRKVSSSLDDIVAKENRIVVLENPRDLNNLGAVVRVCAARGDTSLVITGEASPWHAHAIRGGAGLQWAVPIAQASMEEVLNTETRGVDARKVLACTDEGNNMYEQDVPSDAVLIFGTEREGITHSTRDRADEKLAIPMQEGVSSMNLATSVSAVLFGVTK